MKLSLTLVWAFVLWSAPAHADNDVSGKLAELKGEPSIREVQEAALRYFGLDKDKVDSMRTRAALKALLPLFEVSGGYVKSDVTDESFNFEVGTNLWVSRGVAGNAKDIRGKLAWNLPQLLFNPEELDVASLANAREDIIKKVTDIYYARRHLQVDMLLTPPLDSAAKINNQLRVEKLTSLVDAMTGRWFGEKLSGKKE